MATPNKNVRTPSLTQLLINLWQDSGATVSASDASWNGTLQHIETTADAIICNAWIELDQLGKVLLYNYEKFLRRVKEMQSKLNLTKPDLMNFLV